MNLPSMIFLATVVPAALLLAWGWRLMARANASTGWTLLPGTIRESRVLRQGSANSPRLVFDYQVAGQAHVGRRLWVGPASISVTGDWAKHVVARYPVGTRVRIAVDPADPGYAVLEPGRKPMHWLPVAIASLVMLVGAVLACGFMFSPP